MVKIFSSRRFSGEKNITKIYIPAIIKRPEELSRF